MIGPTYQEAARRVVESDEVDHGSDGEGAPWPLPDGAVKESLLALDDFCELRETEILNCSHAWELATYEFAELERVTEVVPHGGWGNLIALAAGTELCDARPDHFEWRGTRDVIEGFSDIEWREALLRAFTDRIIPPAAAAALYVLMDVHPLWGLQYGRHVGSAALPDTLLFEENQAMLHVMIDWLSEFHQAFLGPLSELRPSQRISVQVLGELLEASVSETAPDSSGVDQGAPFPLRMAQFSRSSYMGTLIIRDLLDLVLVPTGIACLGVSNDVFIDGESLKRMEVLRG